MPILFSLSAQPTPVLISLERFRNRTDHALPKPDNTRTLYRSRPAGLLDRVPGRKLLDACYIAVSGTVPGGGGSLNMASLLFGDDIVSTDNPARILIVASAEEVRLVQEGLREYRDLVNVDTSHEIQSGLAQARSGTHDVVLLTLELPDAWPADVYVRLQREVEEVPILVIARSEDEARIATRTASRPPFCVIDRGRVDPSMVRRLIVSAILFRRADGRPPCSPRAAVAPT
jgi:hypothetical protein